MQGIPSAASDLLARYATFKGVATTTGLLLDLGEYPGLVYHPKSERLVYGQLFELRYPNAAFQWLDSYEGVGATSNPRTDEYTRRTIWVEYRDTRRLATAYVYQLNPRFTKRIDSGNYFQYAHHHARFIRNCER